MHNSVTFSKTLQKNEGELHSDPGMKADLLSQQFESVFVRDSDQIGTPILPGIPFPNFKSTYFRSRHPEASQRA